jgi:hypothetical protein
MTKLTISLIPATGTNISVDIRPDFSMWACDRGIDATEWIATGSTQVRDIPFYVMIVGERAREYWDY